MSSTTNHNKQETIILVDEHDHVVGESEKIAAHQQALLHRAFSVFIIRQNTQLEILLQQRAQHKYHCGGLWTNTCCGHPRPGEATQAAAERRLFEEMGIRTSLQYIDRFQYIAHFANGLTESEIDHVFYQHDDGIPFTTNPDEVQDTQWISIAELKRQLSEQPQQFTPWLSPALQLLCKAI